MPYRFQQTLIADTPEGSRKFSIGDVIDGSEILPGCLASCLHTRALVEVSGEAEPEPAAEQLAGDEQSPAEGPAEELAGDDQSPASEPDQSPASSKPAKRKRKK